MNEPGQVCCGLRWIGEAVQRRVLALQPSADGPLAGVTLGGRSFRDRHRDGKGQERRKKGKPAVILVHLLCLYRPVGKSHSQVIPEPVDRVLCPGGPDRHDGEVRQMRKLRKNFASTMAPPSSRFARPTSVIRLETSSELGEATREEALACPGLPSIGPGWGAVPLPWGRPTSPAIDGEQGRVPPTTGQRKPRA